MHTDIAIVGGSAAGVTAAVTARRHYPDKQITLIRQEEKVPIPCGIPYIFGTVGSVEKNLIPDDVLTANHIDLRVARVTALDPDSHTLATDDGETLTFDRLVLATGSQPVVPPIPGIAQEGIFPIIKDTEYLARMQQALASARDIVVVGGGFIGIEFADECMKLPEKNVTVVELLPHCLSLAYDEEFCTAAEALLAERGIHVLTGKKVTFFTGDGAVRGVALDSGETLPADVVIIGIGAKAEVELAARAGLALGPTGAIAVDRMMKTEHEHIFACGDCAEKVSFFDGKPSALKLASIATYEARIAGANLFERSRANAGTVGVWSTAIGDTAFATAGLTEEMANRQGMACMVGKAEAPNRHPGGMPGMAKMTVKLVFERHTGVLLGGQVAGDKAAGEVVNMISACIQKRMTADDIATFQAGTHPALTASPIAYQFVNAAEIALGKMRAPVVKT